MAKNILTIISKKVLINAIIASFAKLTPLNQAKNPVIFVVYIGSLLITCVLVLSLMGFQVGEHNSFIFGIVFWLWFTVIFSNFAESLSELSSNAQALSLKALKNDVLAKKLSSLSYSNDYVIVKSVDIIKDDIVLVEKGDIIPCDGLIILGCASIDESSITGESAPIIREAESIMANVTAGSIVLSDWIIVKSITNADGSFIDKMISMIESVKRNKTPNEVSLSILLISLTIMFLLVVVTLFPMSIYSVKEMHLGSPISITVSVALLVCLIPTTISGLLAAIGIAGIGRMLGANVLAFSSRAIEAAGDVSVVVFDKTGTLTYGNRFATKFHPLEGVELEELIEASYLSSITDDTLEGKSIITLIKKIKINYLQYETKIDNISYINFSATTKMSGVDYNDVKIRKGAYKTILQLVANDNNKSLILSSIITQLTAEGATPLLISKNDKILGVIELRDLVKTGIKEKLYHLKDMGIKTIMVTGDNELTAKSIAEETGVDEFVAEATPEAKFEIIKKYHNLGYCVAMTGDGVNDAPALALADVAVAMNTGTKIAKEAANMVDLDSDPTKLIKIIEIGKQMLITRGALTTFSISNDVAKYFAIIPAIFTPIYPQLSKLNIMYLKNSPSAVLSAVIFNAVIILFLTPLALRGVSFKPLPARKLLRKNFLIYGIGGIILPFIGIKIINMLLFII